MAELRRDRAERVQSYRDKALKMFPHICARCSRTFDGARLRELTVHHKDHDHRNNPQDGSNWELLCLYCHDHEHEKYKIAGYTEDTESISRKPTAPMFKPFEGLDALFTQKDGGTQDDGKKG